MELLGGGQKRNEEEKGEFRGGVEDDGREGCAAGGVGVGGGAWGVTSWSGCSTPPNSDTVTGMAICPVTPPLPSPHTHSDRWRCTVGTTWPAKG